VELRLSAAEASEGSLLLAEVRSAGPLEEVKGEWDGHTIPFWQEKARRGGLIYRALVGADLEQAPGQYDVKVEWKTQTGETAGCNAGVTVRTGRFATERLQVEQEFVEPSAEQLARAKEDRERLLALYAAATPEKMWQGPFRVPLAGVKKGSNFGRRRILNGQPRSPHSGADFSSAAGTPVHAAQRGRVVLAEALFFSGNTVVIDHGLGMYTLYGHLKAISVQTGDMVGAGAKLGEVGATGRVTGPHLHWGLTVNQARVNPLEVVKLLGSR
jgi:murein DD-endopeptidase MepM/ murein hydrolase activator NlpD